MFIYDCPVELLQEDCVIGTAALECQILPELRLYNSENEDNNSIGRLEVRLNQHDNGTWGSICTQDLTFNIAKKMCQLLGFKNVLRLIDLPPIDSFYPINLELFSCTTGSLHSILNCDVSNWGEATCDHNKDVGLECFAGCLAPVHLNLTVGSTINVASPGYPRSPLFTDYPNDTRIVNETEGGIQFRNQGRWMAICGDFWSDTNAHVACWQMGFLTGLSKMNPFKEGSRRMLPYRINCLGDEKYAYDCPVELLQEDCVLGTAALECIKLPGCPAPVHLNLTVRSTINVVSPGYPRSPLFTDSTDRWQLRITSNGTVTNNFRGILEQRRNKEPWGSVCGIQEVYYTEVTQICKLLGFQQPHPYQYETNHMWRLVNGSKPSEGLLEFRFVDGEWGSVCSTYFYRSTAIQVCKELGFETMMSWYNHKTLMFGGSDRPIFTVGVKEVGEFTSLQPCNPEDIVSLRCLPGF
ncbi:lysyl oxidase homolog 4-like [Amphiura filiformis]|uniref:lysyl oxidase homolog 4-like n=1 Tax=Amphiura filiformis TaxID=82378 RepID=UPI003B223CFB